MTLNNLIGLPDGGEAGCLRCHNIDTVTEVNRQVLNTGADELQHLILNITGCEGFLYEGKRHIVRADTLSGSAGQIYKNNLGHIQIPGVFKKLLNKLRTALADTHSTQGAVTGMRVGTENHVAAGGQLFTRVGVNDALVGRYVDTAVLLCCGKTENVVVLVDGTANGAQTVVAVGHGIGQRELGKPAGACGLDNTNVGNVMGNHSVELDFQLVIIIVRIV